MTERWVTRLRRRSRAHKRGSDGKECLPLFRQCRHLGGMERGHPCPHDSLKTNRRNPRVSKARKEEDKENAKRNGGCLDCGGAGLRSFLSCSLRPPFSLVFFVVIPGRCDPAPL